MNDSLKHLWKLSRWRRVEETKKKIKAVWRTNNLMEGHWERNSSLYWKKFLPQTLKSSRESRTMQRRWRKQLKKHYKARLSHNKWDKIGTKKERNHDLFHNKWCKYEQKNKEKYEDFKKEWRQMLRKYWEKSESINRNEKRKTKNIVTLKQESHTEEVEEEECWCRRERTLKLWQWRDERRTKCEEKLSKKK